MFINKKPNSILKNNAPSFLSKKKTLQTQTLKYLTFLTTAIQVLSIEPHM